MTGDAAGTCRVVVGIGLNVAMPQAAATDIDQAWTDLAQITGGTQPSRGVLLGAILDQLLPLLAGFEEQGFAPWMDEWNALDAYAGAEVILHGGSRQMAGVARGVDGRGALQLETATTGVQSVFGGEISLRPAQ